MELPTLKGTLASMSPNVARRWNDVRAVIDKDEYKQPRYDPHPGLGRDAPGCGNGQGALPIRQPQGQCADRPGGDNGVSWYKIASDFISMGRAIRLTSDQAPRWSVDVNYDIYRPVDFPSV